jgi:hypothetical protein
MTISRIGQATAQATSIAIPGTYAAGDLVVIAASRANTTQPTLAAGWVALSGTGDNNSSLLVACKYAQSASESDPTFTNAGILNCAVYRSSLGVIAPSMGVSATTAASATINFPALANYRTGVDANWYVGIATSLNITNSIETAPTGMANVNFDSITGLKAALHDTNGDHLSNWPLTSVTVATSTRYRSAVIQLIEMAYTFPSGGGGVFDPLNHPLIN